MLRRGKKIGKRLVNDASGPSLTVHHSERMPITDNASLESTVFGGEGRITEQLENFEVVASGIKVSSLS